MAKAQQGRTRRPRNWRELFLEQLAQSSNVAASARAAGVDVSTVYKARRNEKEFQAAWHNALCEGYDALEMDLLCRLREGQGKDQEDRKHDNATAFRLLTIHREAVSKTKASRSSNDEKAIIAAINAKLDMMRDRMREKDAKVVDHAPNAAGAITDKSNDDNK